jgi:MFS family permease
VTASEPAVGASYRELFARPVLRRLAAADVCARLPQGMVSITLLLVAGQHASMRVAGLVVAGYTLGQAVTGPARGRLVDRHGLFPVAAVCGLGYALALVALLAGSLAAAPAGLLVGAATAAGLVNTPLSPGMRSLWAAHAGARLKQAAFALDAALFDLAYITGPALAGVLATGLTPAAAVAALLTLTGIAVITIAGPARRPRDRGSRPARRRSPLGPLRLRALRDLLIAAALVNVALSATEVALIAYVRDHHAMWASGLLLAGFASARPVLALALAAAAAVAAALSAALTARRNAARAPRSVRPT